MTLAIRLSFSPISFNGVSIQTRAYGAGGLCAGAGIPSGVRGLRLRTGAWFQARAIEVDGIAVHDSLCLSCPPNGPPAAQPLYVRHRFEDSFY